MGDPSSHVNGNVTEAVGIGVNGTVWVPNPLNPPDFKSDVYTTPTIGIPDLFSLPPVTINTINLSAPGQNVDLGNLLPNNIAPTVAMDTIPTDGVEGSPIQLSVKGTGPGGSLSPCGDEASTSNGSFGDGVRKTVNHAWTDNFLGNPSPPHTGQVVITDPTGLKERLASVGEHDHVSRLDVRRGVLDHAEVVAGRVVEAVHGHESSLAGDYRRPGRERMRIAAPTTSAATARMNSAA